MYITDKNNIYMNNKLFTYILLYIKHKTFKTLKKTLKISNYRLINHIKFMFFYILYKFASRYLHYSIYTK